MEISRKRESKGQRDGMIKKREEMCASEKYQCGILDLILIRVTCNPARLPPPSGSHMTLMKVKAFVTGSELTHDKY